MNVSLGATAALADVDAGRLRRLTRFRRLHPELHACLALLFLGNH